MALPSILASSATFAVVTASLTSTEIAPETVALPPLPETAPARDWAAIRPRYLPVVFWVRSAAMVTSPVLPL